MTLPPPFEITTAPPNGWVGPGLQLDWKSHFIGPISYDATYRIDIFPVGDERAFYTETVPSYGGKFGGVLLNTELLNTPTWREASLADGTDVTVRIALIDQDNEIDVGIITAPWKPVQGLATQATQYAYHLMDAVGLKPDQAQQLAEVHQSTALTVALDTLTLSELPAGAPGQPINAQLLDPVFGIIVRITGVPPEHSPSTPDGDYWYASLAVVRIYRGTDVWLRVPVHTSSKLISLLNEGIVAAVPAALGALWMLNLSVQVTFAPGVVGHVYLMRFP